MSALLTPVTRSVNTPAKGARLRVVPAEGHRIGNVGFIAIVLAFVGLAMFGQVALATQIQQMQFALSTATREDQALADRREMLRAELARTSSVTELTKKAEALGMVPAGNLGFLKSDGTVAGNPKPATNTDFTHLRTASQLEADRKAKAEADARKKAEEEAAAKKKADEEAAKKKAEEEAAKKKAEAEAANKPTTAPTTGR